MDYGKEKEYRDTGREEEVAKVPRAQPILKKLIRGFIA